TLALFLVPLIILEPVKPVAAYLMASGRVRYGVAVLVIGEILKITIVERLFHIGRDKLMTIAAFARAYSFVTRWLAYLKSLPAWQATMRHVQAVKAAAHAMWQRLLSATDSHQGAEDMMTEQTTNVVLGTATPGGGFPLYGDALIAAVNEVDPSLAIE